MAQPSENRIRLTILGGYLGSGKTTWLRHQLFQGRFGRAHIMVNEAAETPVDDALLARDASGMTLLAGGCACCEGKADLIDALHRICDARSRVSADDERLEQIVLETSGLADPGAIVEAIRSDPVLVSHILVVEILVTVDALHAIQQLGTEPLGRRQIEAADHLILTKVDGVPPEVLSGLVGTLKALNPGAAMSAAVKGSAVPLEVQPGVPAIPLPDLDPSDSRAPIRATRLVIDDAIDWGAFSVWLSALLYARGDDLVRVKGVLRSPAGRLLLQTVRKSVQSPEILPDQGHDNTIVFIGRGFTAEELQRSLHYFAGLTATAPAG